MESKHYDVVVIGGGTAGSSAAREAAAQGARTLMIHEPRWWNLCIQRGCMPSKSVLAAAEVAHTARHAGSFRGVEHDGEVRVNFAELLARKDDHVARFERSLHETFAGEDFETLHGTARFADDRALRVTTESGEETITGARYVIATGSQPFVPPIDGLADVAFITSDDVMENRVSEAPARLFVLGGGPIGLELATLFARAGSRVTVADMQAPLSPFASVFGDELRAALKARDGIDVRAPVRVVGFEKAGDTTYCILEQDGREERIETDVVLVATGRAPALAKLGLEHVDVAMPEGKLEFNEYAQTSNPDIFAAGDVTKDVQILHVAAEEGRVAGRNAARGEAGERVDYAALSLSVVFTDPPVAHVGLLERDMEGRDDLVRARIRFPETGRAIVMGVEHGLWELVAERDSGKIVSSTIIGPRADDLIHAVFLAYRLGISVRDLARIPAYHPTLSEQFAKLTRLLAEQHDTKDDA